MNKIVLNEAYANQFIKKTQPKCQRVMLTKQLKNNNADTP